MFKKPIFRALRFPLIALVVMWIVKLAEFFLNTSFAEFGLRPRDLVGLRGIIFMPFLHGDFEHLISNSMPCLLLSTALFHFYQKTAWKILFWIWIMSGLWLWMIEDPHTHIGASAVIYGLVSFLFFAGIFHKQRQLLSFSLLIAFLYGGLIWGILPTTAQISWQGHLFGFIAGLICAIYFQKTTTKLFPKKKLSDTPTHNLWQYEEKYISTKESED